MADDLKSLSAIFNGDSLFRIPDYQRGYAWQSQQLLDFWDDIFNLEDKPGNSMRISNNSHSLNKFNSGYFSFYQR